MKVSQLILELQKCPHDSEVVLFLNWDHRLIPINEISPEGDDRKVVLGESLPSEMYARDYREV